jgi:hypothetical protein
MSRSDDSIRNQQVTTFHCAVCGEHLKVAYTPDARPKDGDERDMPTGAAMLRTKLSIWPCQKCMQPAKDVSAALGVLAKIASQSKG